MSEWPDIYLPNFSFVSIAHFLYRKIAIVRRAQVTDVKMQMDEKKKKQLRNWTEEKCRIKTT